jgi:hypothetical protein
MFLVLGLAACSGVVGCASGGDASRKQLDDLAREVTRLKAAVVVLEEQSALTQRRGAVAPAPPEAPPVEAPSASPAPPSDRPELEVVTLAPTQPTVALAAPATPTPGANPTLRNTPDGRMEGRSDGRATVYEAPKAGGKKK